MRERERERVVDKSELRGPLLGWFWRGLVRVCVSLTHPDFLLGNLNSWVEASYRDLVTPFSLGVSV